MTPPVDRLWGKPVYRLLRSVKRDQKGATAVEYGLIIAMIVLAMMAALNNVAIRTNSMWSNVANKVSNN
jgi:pilus assembly protein Flp/PilA